MTLNLTNHFSAALLVLTIFVAPVSGHTQQLEGTGIYSTKQDELSYIRFETNSETQKVRILRCAVSGSGCNPIPIGGREYSQTEIAIASKRLIDAAEAKVSTCDPFFTSLVACMAGGFTGGIITAATAAAVTGVGIGADAAYLSGLAVACTASVAANFRWFVTPCTLDQRKVRGQKLLSQNFSNSSTSEFHTDELIELLNAHLPK